MAIESLHICGLDELSFHAETGATHVLSILDPDWPVPAAFATYRPHARLELRFHDVIEPPAAPEIVAPLLHHAEAVLDFGRDLARHSGPVRLLVHCHAGISRSTASAALLLAQADAARDPDEIIAWIVGIRPKAWPNLRLLELGDQALGRTTGLIPAARRRYAALSAARPEIARLMRADGRGREVDG